MLFILLVADIIGGIILEAAGVRAAVGSGADLALVVLTYILVIHWVRRRTGQPWSEIFPLQPFQPTLLAPLLVMVLGFSITGSEVDNLVRFSLPIPGVFKEILRELVRPDFLSLAYIALLAPVFEELLFRGIILQGFLHHYSYPKAILSSAVLFAAFHLNPIQFFPALGTGLILAWLFVRTRSLWPCMLVHALTNSIVWIMSVLLPLRIPGYMPANLLLDRVEFQPLWFDVLGVLSLVAGLKGLSRTLPTDVAESFQPAATDTGSAESCPTSACAEANTAVAKTTADRHA